MMIVSVKKLHKDAVIPRYAKPGDAGMDLTVTSTKIDFHNPNKLIVGFGIAMEIPTGYVGLVFPRSSIHKTGCRLTNCVGVIDSGYRGEICAVFDKSTFTEDVYNIGDRAAQIIILPYPQVEFVAVDELSTTERGEGGYGSTGK